MSASDPIADVGRPLREVPIPPGTLSDDILGTYTTLAQVRDPDGNQVTLATPPSPPYPPATQAN